MAAAVGPDLALLQRTAEQAGRHCVVGAVIFDGKWRVFAPRRSLSASILPGIWDLVGGHVEVGESLEDALRREVTEETGWTVVGEPTLVFVSDWDVPGSRPSRRREFDFIVSIDGDLTCPALAPDEHVDFRWIDRDSLDVFDENAGLDDGLVRRIVEGAFATLPRETLTRPHATIFLDDAALDIEELRRFWDPVMASQIGAHMTLAYPHEVPDLDELTGRVRSAVRTAAPFELHLGAVVHDGDPTSGVFVQVYDPDGAWRRLRSSIAGPPVEDSIPAHITLIHPRTSALGPTAWDDLQARNLRRTVRVASVAVTAFDGKGWATVSTHALG